MGGTAEILTDPEEVQRVGALFKSKFPQLAALPIPEDPAHIIFIKVKPLVASVLDYSKGFGYTELVSINA
jgi:hypothetical protein